METGWAVVLLISALILALQLVRPIPRRAAPAEDVDGPNYQEPILKIDAAVQAPQEVFGELESTLLADKDANRRYLRERDTDRKLTDKLPVSRKVLVTAGCVIAFIVAPYVHPSLSWMRLLSEGEAGAGAQEPEVGGAPLPSASVGEARIPGATLDEEGRSRELEGAADSRGPIAHGGKPVAVGPAVDEQKPPRPIDDPSGKALDKFFAKLAAVETKQPNAIARVLYYGESIVA